MSLAVLLLLLLSAVGGGWLWTPDLDRAQLETRYAAPPSQFVDVLGLRVHLRDTGPRDAPAVILLHGFGASLHTWDDWAAGLQDARRVVRIDLPGAGLTGADPSGDYSDERGLQIVLALMDQLGLPQASIVGHSMGGRLAWRLAALHPERVDKLVLLAPDGFASPGFQYGKAPKVPTAVHLMRYALPKLLVRKSLEPAYADPRAMTDERLTRYHELLLAPGVRQALIARMGQVVLQDPVPLLQRIQAPTLLLWGMQDAMIPVANAQDYLRALPDARLVTLPGVGHLVQEEAAAASLAVVRDFLLAAPG